MWHNANTPHTWEVCFSLTSSTYQRRLIQSSKVRCCWFLMLRKRLSKNTITVKHKQKEDKKDVSNEIGLTDMKTHIFRIKEP